jgi:hypothetical protein
VRQARTHIRHIVDEFGCVQLSAVPPSHVKAWAAKQKDHAEPSYVYAPHSRLSQIMSDAVHDGVLGRNLASLLIASGADIKTVQVRMLHASARTTLDTCGQMPMSPPARRSVL